MIRRLRNKMFADALAGIKSTKRRCESKRRRLMAKSYEVLEARQMLAFSALSDGITLTLTQTANDGNVTIDNSGGVGQYRTTDSAGSTAWAAPGPNLIVNLLDGTSNTLDFDLDNSPPGNIELNLGEGARAVNFIGTSNSIGGDLTVNAGAGNQTIEVGVNAGLSVGGNLMFDLGLGLDQVDEDNSNIAVTGNWDFVNVNFFENGGTMSVGGNVTVDTTGEVEDTLFDDDATMTIAGDFTFTGGDGRDEITMNGVAAGTSVLGNALIDAGDNTIGGSQLLFFNLPNSSVGGTLTAISTSSTNFDSFATHPSGNYGGDISVNLGEGPNDAFFAGVFGGTNIEYRGGSDIDNVTFGTTGNPANVNLVLGTGDDNFTLNAGASISPTTLRVDFGGGVDSFFNAFGMFTFNAAFLNWDNFNRFYFAGLDQWNMVQVATDTNDVTISTNGGPVELTNTYFTSMSGAANVRLNMVNDTGNVAVELNSALAGNLILDLKHGARNVDFIGTNNSIGGFLRIEAADGDQIVELAVNQDLNVVGSTVINLREGVDVVDDDGNNITVSDYLIFRGVNAFETEGTVIVDNFTMNTSFEVAPARLDNDGSFTVFNNMLYLGGVSKDDIVFNNGAFVGGNAYFNLGDNEHEYPAQNINLSDSTFNGRLTVKGGVSNGGNSLVTNSATSVEDFFVVDFSANTSDNLVFIDGTFNGNFGLYRGGSGDDVVTMDEVAGDMDFFMTLGAGEDTFNLGDGTLLNYLYVNFGDDFDTFNDEFFGTYPFNTAFHLLP